MNAGPQDGAALAQVTQKRGRRWSPVDAYLRPALRRRNLRVVTGAQAARILFDGRRAAGVEYALARSAAAAPGAPATAPGSPGAAPGSAAAAPGPPATSASASRVAFAAREVIVACGAVNSPQRLMLSGIGPGEDLRALGIPVVRDAPGVGRNLVDHLAVGLALRVRSSATLFAAESWGNLLRYVLLGRGPLTSNVAEGLAFVRTSPDLPAPDVEILFAPVPCLDHGRTPPPCHGVPAWPAIRYARLPPHARIGRGTSGKRPKRCTTRQAPAEWARTRRRWSPRRCV